MKWRSPGDKICGREHQESPSRLFPLWGYFREISAPSSKSVLECCVIPVLLYGCENWILTEPLCQKLESLQSELVKRMLKHLSNTAALTTLEVPTVRSRVLQRKLSFLHRVANSNPFSLSGRTVLALSQDINSLCLVKECSELEEGFGTHFTDDILARREVHPKPKDIRANHP